MVFQAIRRLSIAVWVVAAACGSRAPSSLSAVDGAGRDAQVGGSMAPVSTPGVVHATASVSAECGTDGIRREPVSLADLDGDGTLDRVSVTRDGKTLVVRLHRLPDFETAGEWRIPGTWAEVAAVKCGDDTRGGLYLDVSAALDDKGNRWSRELYRLVGKKLEVMADAITEASVVFDLDGDGCPDPIVADASGTRMFRHGAWEKAPKQAGDLRLVGERFDGGQQRAIDLDGDGDRDFLRVADDGLSIVDEKSFAPSFAWKGKVWGAGILEWKGKRVIAANIGENLRVFATDSKHGELFTMPAQIYENIESMLDVGGDGSALTVHGLVDGVLRDGSSAPATLGSKLALPIEGTGRLGPVALVSSGAPELVGVKIDSRGSPMIAFPGSDARYELVAFASPLDIGAKPRVIHSADLRGDLDASAKMVDLEHDGVFEILVRESTSYSNCDMKGGGGEARTFLLDGHGKQLWSSGESEWIQGERGARGDDVRINAVDLWGDHRLALHVRAGATERYVLPRGAIAPAHLPPCIE